MKLKILLLSTIILIILMIGSVSASDDLNNATDIPVSIDEISSDENETLNEDYTVNIDTFTTIDKTNITEDDFIEIEMPVNSTGNITIKIDEKIEKRYNGPYTSPISFGANLILSPGNHVVNVTYTGNGTIEDFSEVENILVTHIKVDVDEEIKYGENITMTLDLPATSDTLIINGKKQEINSTTEEFTYPLTDLTYGENYIIIEYGGEKLNKTVEVVANLEYPTEITFNTNFNVSIKLPSNANGNLSVSLNEANYTKKLVNGIATLTLEGLSVGKYDMTINYTGEDYIVNPTEVDLIVKPVIKLKTDIWANENYTVYIEFANTFNGNFTININGSEYKTRVINGKGNITLNDLTVGDDLETNITYTDDMNGYSYTDSQVINVHSENPTFTIDTSKFPKAILENTSEFEATLIVPEGLNGNITISYNNVILNTIDCNEEGSEIQLVINATTFKKGINTLNISYDGDEYFNPTSVNHNIDVTYYVISVSDIIYDRSISVEVPLDFTGNVNLYINGKAYETLEIEAGSGGSSFDLNGLNDGSYSYSISFNGNNKYGKFTQTGTFTLSYLIEVEFADEINYGDSVTIKVNAPDDITRITLNVGSNSYTVSLDNGEGSQTISNLASGKYEVVTKFGGNSKYKAKTFNNNWLEVNYAITTTGESFDEKCISLVLPRDAKGNFIVEIENTPFSNKTLTNGTASIKFGGLAIGSYNVNAYYDGEDYPVENFTELINIAPKITFNGKSYPQDGESIPIYPQNNNIITVELPNVEHTKTLALRLLTESNVRTIKEIVSPQGKVDIVLDDLTLGYATISVFYDNDILTSYDIEVKPKITAPLKIIKGTGTLIFELPSDAGGKIIVSYYDALKESDVEKTISLSKGKASMSLAGLDSGDQEIIISYSDSKYGNWEGSVNVEVLEYELEYDDLTIAYTSTSKYKVRLFLGESPVAGETISFKIKNKVYKVKTDKNGYANLGIKLAPKRYNVIISFRNIKEEAEITVKSIIVAKHLKIKKSAKKSLIKVTIKKVDKKILKGKKILLRFAGKKYVAKVNKKGIATFKIPKKAVKKLKVGRKYKYTVSYKSDKVTRTIAIRK